MDRWRDYIGFAVQFLGLSYIGLWPLSTPGRGDLFAAAYVCGGMLDRLCSLPHPLRFGIGLHAFGALCAVLSIVNLSVCALRRLRRRAGGAPAPDAAAAALVPVVVKRTRWRAPPPRKRVRARAHFGLRGLPR